MPMDWTGEVAAARAEELRRRTAPPAGCAVAEREVPSPGGSPTLRSYRSAAAHSGEAAGLLFFHAGGFVSGAASSHAAFCGQLSLASGCVVVSCAYRLAPEHGFPR